MQVRVEGSPAVGAFKVLGFTFSARDEMMTVVMALLTVHGFLVGFVLGT
jgi:hypothetical protein